VNHRYLIELMAAVAATAALWGCASVPAPQHTVDMRRGAARELGIARNAWAQCIRAAIPRLDDLQSSSEVLSSEAVARAALKSCSGEYADMVRALAGTLAPNCARDSACTRDAMARAQRTAMQVATDDVVIARIGAADAAALRCE